MRRILWRLVLVLLVVLPGCAFKKTIERGHDYVAQGRYRDAYGAYEQALALEPDSKEARRLVDQLRPYAIGEAEDEAGAAIAAGKYEDGLRLAGYVRRLDVARGDALAATVERWMRAGIEGLVAERKMEEAYPVAVRARRLFPRMAGIDDTFAKLRAHFHDRSDRALASRDFPGALTALDVIERHEPDQRAALAPKRDAIRQRWADAVVAKGEVAETEGHPGVAAVHYARAYEIAARRADADRMHEALRELEREGRFALALEFEGDGRRAGVLSRLEAGARATEGVRIATREEGATMLAVVRADPIHCSQGFEPVTGQQEYVAGTRMVDNPRYLEINAAIAKAGADADRLGRELARLRADASRDGRAARECLRRDEQPAARRLEQLRQVLRRAESAEAAQRAQVDALRSEMNRRMDPEERARKERELAQAEEELARLEARRADAQQQVVAQEAVWSQAQQTCRALSDAASQAEAGALETQAALRAREREIDRLEGERRTTPAQVSEPIIDVFHYEIRRFTRVCEGSVAVDVEPAWTRGERRTIPTSRATRDDTHPAHPRYGVSADPLHFPLGDDDLRGGADDDAAQAILTMLTGFVRDYYASMTDRASEMATTDTETATDMMVALLVAAPEQLSPQHRDRIAVHLRQHYGLEHLGTLSR